LNYKTNSAAQINPEAEKSWWKFWNKWFLNGPSEVRYSLVAPNCSVVLAILFVRH
jgi:hypothetical protein